MKVAFVCRGYPGLGKVMGALAIGERLAREEGAELLFLSYYQGRAYLEGAGYAVEDLLAGGLELQPTAFCAPFGPETRRAAEVLEGFGPDLVINDGEPYLVEVTADVLRLKTVVLAHPLDLHNPQNAPLAIRLYRHYYSRADLVLSHGLRRLPAGGAELGGRAGRAREINTVVRDAIAQAPPGSGAPGSLLGVLGGGVRNASADFEEGTRRLGTWILRAAAELGIERRTLLCADRALRDHLSALPESAGAELIAEPVDNTRLLIEAGLVVGRAGRNLVSELVALGKAGVVVPVGGTRFRTSGQVLTAERAASLDPNLRPASLEDGYEAFAAEVRAALEGERVPVDWRPGNEVALAEVRRLLGRER